MQGRPKGHDLTVIGLPATKKAKSSEAKNRLQPFFDVSYPYKEKKVSMHICTFMDCPNSETQPNLVIDNLLVTARDRFHCSKIQVCLYYIEQSFQTKVSPIE